MKIKIILILTLSTFTNFAKCQTNEVGLNFVTSKPYEFTLDSINKNYLYENGVLQAPKINGLNLDYGRLIYDPWKVYLNAGFNFLTQTYRLDIYNVFTLNQDIQEVKINNRNLYIGVSKRINLIDSVLQIITGVNVISRNYGTKTYEFGTNVIDTMNVQDNTNFTSITLNNNQAANGKISIGFNFGLKYNITKHLFLKTLLQIEPFQNLNYSFQTTSWSNAGGNVYYFQEKYGPTKMSFKTFNLNLGLGLNF